MINTVHTIEFNGMWGSVCTDNMFMFQRGSD